MCFYNICYFDYYCIFKGGEIVDGLSSVITYVKEICITLLQLSKAVFFFFFILYHALYLTLTRSGYKDPIRPLHIEQVCVMAAWLVTP